MMTVVAMMAIAMATAMTCINIEIDSTNHEAKIRKNREMQHLHGEMATVTATLMTMVTAIVIAKGQQ